MKKETKYAIFLNSVGGTLVILLCVVAFNVITAQFKIKADLTDGNLFTLSKGSKELLDGLAEEREDDASSPLEIRFYITRGEKGVPVVVNEHGTRVEDLLDQYKAYAGGNLELQKINPRRDTDAEELAVNDGMRLLNNAFYIGMAVSYLDSTEVIPAGRVAVLFLPLELASPPWASSGVAPSPPFSVASRPSSSSSLASAARAACSTPWACAMSAAPRARSAMSAAASAPSASAARMISET